MYKKLFFIICFDMCSIFLLGQNANKIYSPSSFYTINLTWENVQKVLQKNYIVSLNPYLPEPIVPIYDTYSELGKCLIKGTDYPKNYFIIVSDVNMGDDLFIYKNENFYPYQMVLGNDFFTKINSEENKRGEIEEKDFVFEDFSFSMRCFPKVFPPDFNSLDTIYCSPLSTDNPAPYWQFLDKSSSSAVWNNINNKDGSLYHSFKIPYSLLISNIGRFKSNVELRYVDYRYSCMHRGSEVIPVSKITVPEIDDLKIVQPCQNSYNNMVGQIVYDTAKYDLKIIASKDFLNNYDGDPSLESSCLIPDRYRLSFYLKKYISSWQNPYTTEITIDKPITVNVNNDLDYFTTPKSYHVRCHGNSQLVNLTYAGGKSGTGYIWEMNLGQNILTATGEPFSSNLTDGTYNVSLTNKSSDGKYSCTVSLPSITVTQPEEIKVNQQLDRLAKCFNEPSLVNFIIRGGTTNSSGNGFSYTWNGGVSTPITGSSFSKELVLSSNPNYSFQVVDANNCSSDIQNRSTSIINEPANISYSLQHVGGSTYTTPNSVVIEDCSSTDGKATVKFIVSGGKENFILKDKNNNSYPVNANFILLPGDYTFLLTDDGGNGCTKEMQVKVLSPFRLALQRVAQPCGGGKGSIELAPSGGSGTYTVTSSTSATEQNGSTIVARNLEKGNYSYTISDGFCSRTQSAVLVAPLSFSVEYNGNVINGESLITLENCSAIADGSVSVKISASGASGTYTLLKGSSSVGLKTATSLAVGDHSFLLSDSDGCLINFTIRVLPKLLVSLAGKTNACNGTDGAITLQASGGSGTYKFENGAQVVNPSTVDSKYTIGGLSAGSYSIKVSDGYCSVMKSDISIYPPVTFSATSAMDCGKEKSDIAVAGLTGGNRSYSYLLTGSEGRSGTLAEGDGAIRNLNSGIYSLEVKSDGCAHTVSNIAVYNRPVIKKFDVINPECQGHEARFDYEVVEGNSPKCSYTLTFDRNGTQQSQTTDLNTLSGSVDVDVTGKVKLNINQCSISQEKDVTINRLSIGGIVEGSWNCHLVDGKPSGGTLTVPVNTNFTSYTVKLIRLENGKEDIVEEQACVKDKNNYTFAISKGGTFKFSVVTPNGCSAESKPYSYEPKSSLSIKTVTPTHPVCYGMEGTVRVEVENLGSRTLSGDGNVLVRGSTATFRSVAGERTYKVSDGFCYLETASVTLNNPEKPSFNAVVVNPPCNGDKAEVRFTEVAPAGTYSYFINNDSYPNSSVNLSVAQPSTRIDLKVVNDRNCQSDVVSKNITMPATLETRFTADPVLCNGGKTGAINLDAVGGTTSYEYYLVNESKETLLSGNRYENLQNGSYTIKVKDKNSCKASKTVVVSEPDKLSFVSVPAPPTCRDGNDGKIALTVSGGNAGSYEYKRGNENYKPLVNSIVGGLTPNTYDLTIKDPKGCEAEKKGILVDNQPEWIWNIATVSPTCSDNGEIKISSIENGYGNYRYYKDGVTGASILQPLTNLAVGKHTVSVIDEKKCIQTTEQTLKDNALTVTATPTHVTCYGGNDGTVEVTISGGRRLENSSYSCRLMKGTSEITSNVSITNNNQNGSQTIIYNKLYANDYTLFVSDASNCSRTLPIKLTQFEKSIDFKVTPFEADSCQGKGRIEVSNIDGIQGSKDDLIYTAGNLVQKGNPTFIVNTGAYDVTVTDSKGCKTTKGTVIKPEKLVAKFELKPMDCSGNNNGSVTIIQLEGGLGKLSTSCKLTSEAEPKGSEYTSQLVYQGLKPGSYKIYGRDESNRCLMSVGNFEIKDVEPLQLSYVPTQPTCNGYNDGSVSLQVTGGNGGYKLIAFGGNVAIAEESGRIGGFAKGEGLKAGTYKINLTDKNGCLNTGTDKIVVTEPEPVTLQLEKVDSVSCKGNGNGRIYLKAQGGNGNYVFTTTKNLGAFKSDANQPSSYHLDQLVPATYAFNVTDGKGCLLSKPIDPVTIVEPEQLTLAVASFKDLSCYQNASGSITVKHNGGNEGKLVYALGALKQEVPIFTNLAAGTHSITVSDRKGCTSKVDQELVEPSLLKLTSINEKDPLCFGYKGSITPQLAGGTPPYEVKVDGETSYSAPKKLDLLKGSYLLKYKDSKGCEFPRQFTLKEPEKLVVQKSVESPLCTGWDGKLTLSATGGTLPYKFRFKEAEFDVASEFTVKKGDYKVAARDNNGCLDSITVSVLEPSELSLSSDYKNPLCFGLKGSILLKASGGVAPYRYTTNLTATFPTSGTLVGDKDQQISFGGLLPNAAYVPAVMDANGCIGKVDPITLSQPEPLEWLADDVTHLKCADDGNGAIKVALRGGTLPYSYALNDLGNANGLFEKLSGGMYTLKGVDSHGCSLQKEVALNEPSKLAVATSLDPQRCFTSCDGKISAYPSGGTLPYTISWNDPSNNGKNLLTNLCGGEYLLNIMDANGCVVKKDLSFAMPEQIVLNLGLKDTTLCKGQSIVVTPSPQKWGLLWLRDGKFIANGASFTVTEPGSYNVKALDSKGCSVDFGFGVTYVSDVMNPDFLMSSKVAATDTLAIVDISNPKPAKVEWKIDPNARVIQKDGSYLFIAFDKPGIYSIGMVAYTGSCATSVEKRIEVGPKEDRFDINKGLGYKESILKSFKLLPNPSDGVFKVRITLNRKADAMLQLIAVGTGSVLDKKELQGDDLYEVDFSRTDLRQGFYLVNLIVEGRSYSLKMVKI